MKNFLKSKTQKPRLLFVDHIFHTKTRSFDFLVKILEDVFDVIVVYIDPAEPVDTKQLEDRADYVVIAQMDFLTPLFVVWGKRVTVVQMYDGSAGLPDDHFELNRQVQYLNFSVSLHARAIALGAKSHLVRYFPEPISDAGEQDFSTLRGFFWQRLPNANLNLPKVRKLLENDLDSLHVHTPTDDGTPFDPEILEGMGCDVTTSDWFEHHSDFTKIMDGCNVFVAPRIAEGIGHAFLEAMARGMVVIAHDLPTHNEYISNWTNGILFSDQVSNIPLKENHNRLAEISKNAKLSVAVGHQAWKDSHGGICDFVKNADQAVVPDLPELVPAVQELLAAYQMGIANYTAALQNNKHLCHMLGHWSELQAQLSDKNGVAKDIKAPKEDHIFFGFGAGDSILENGWATPEKSHVWAIERQASLNIPLPKDNIPKSIGLNCRGIVEGDLFVFANGTKIGKLNMGGTFRAENIKVPKKVFNDNLNILNIELKVPEKTKIPSLEDRTLTFACKAISLYF